MLGFVKFLVFYRDSFVHITPEEYLIIECLMKERKTEDVQFELWRRETIKSKCESGSML